MKTRHGRTVARTERAQGAHLRTAAVESGQELIARLQRENELDEQLAGTIIRGLRERVAERNARIAAVREEVAGYERMSLAGVA